MALLYRKASLGRWAMVAWDPQRFLAPYVTHFVEELVIYCRRNYPGRDLLGEHRRCHNRKSEPDSHTWMTVVGQKRKSFNVHYVSAFS